MSNNNIQNDFNLNEYCKFIGDVLVHKIKVSIEEWEEGTRSIDGLIDDLEKAIREYQWKQEDLERLI
ncbi:MAG: hypothetical protein K2H85_08000 [Allobaculum sp.]|nr:hypothetical protein [Allobaculum sp.]